MSRFNPVVQRRTVTVSDRPPGAPAVCHKRLQELDRFEWRSPDGYRPGPDRPRPDRAARIPAGPGQGGPVEDLLEAFLAGHGLPVRDLSRPGHHDPDASVCGAAVLLAAGAGTDPGAPAGPAPAVPDLVAVVYGHDHSIDPAVNEPLEDRWSLGPWRSSWSPERHAEAVRVVRKAIARGDVYQVNLVGHASAPYRGDPAAALHRVAGLPGARYGGVLTGDGWAVACASPETLVEVAEGRAVTRPIKGTRPATAAGRAELLASAKERAEHVMIVDLERNDLARVAVTGSVRVDDLYAVRRWCGLWQAESTVSARLVPGTGLAALLRAVFPGGSVTGAPKRAALDVIAALEPVGRGPSMGALGWVGPDRVDLGLTIRTVAADRERLHLWAGGGITWGSDPAAEVAEAAAKAGPIISALRPVRRSPSGAPG
jgi:para-aminobenzoate synthetase component 1